MRRQHLPPVGLHHVPVVAPAADFQVRREQREEPQLGEQLGVGLQASVDEHTVLMGIGDNFLDDPVATLGIDIGDSITQRVRGQALVGVVQMSFVAEKGFPIGDEILQVADLRPIDGRVVDLVEDAFGDRKPDPAQSRVSGPHTVLVTPCPAGLDAGAAGAGCWQRSVVMAIPLWPISTPTGIV